MINHAAETRAEAIFAELDDYGRTQLCRWGTAFTTYEDEGDEVCVALRAKADAWRASLQQQAAEP